jgi:ABC-2 type transport system permease protein
MSKAITEKTEEKPPQGWGPGTEIAPSVVREDEPTVARTIGLIGAAFVIFGAVALLIHATRQDARVGVGLASVCLALGVVGLLAHAAFDRDLQVRRLYWGAGLGLILLGILLCLIPVGGGVGGLFALGYPSLFAGLFFLLAVLHHESDLMIRTLTLRVIGATGLAAVVVAFVVGFFIDYVRGLPFLVPHGALLGLLGLVYLCSFVSQTGTNTDLGFRSGLALGAIGLVGLLLGVVGTIFRGSYLIPGGLLFVGLGILYLGAAIGQCVERPLVVLTKRELAAYFFSPLIYLVVIGMSVVAWVFYSQLLSYAVHPRIVLPEPIIEIYMGLGAPEFLTLPFFIPVLTMRLLSEEKRTGSLEVLLTAPVKETTVVLSKFLAAFLLYLFVWSPWWLFLIALRVGGGESFDYRPLFSFMVALSVIGASFVSMGLFFSSLTRNQVASAVLTFAMIMLYIGFYLLKGQASENPDSTWLAILTHIDYVGLWRQSIKGILIPAQLLFHVSMAVIWLFLTVKVLEARRWA